ncbi:hypothetical protein BYT27DRAFT_7142393 [Phlegmacium glaucopus]|nr:hypothetical protein BYT27DRAFT_7142393 [Phlegmacium glaucopus]
MLSNPHDLNAEIPLPQCGFGDDIDFNSLIKSNHFLFRVYSPKERSPFSDPSDPFFVAPKFDEQFTRSPVDLPDASTLKFPEPVAGSESYSEVARHMEWTTRSTSPYISTSFSFSWSIWEAVRRYHFGVKKDVQIAIIDASVLKGRAATAVQLLQNSSPNQRDKQFQKWHRFSHDSQSVLVYGMIPRPAVLASIPILQILHKMPSYFLRKDVQRLDDDGNPLGQVAWDYTKQKTSYRRFCQHVSKLFCNRPVEVRLRDCTAGAVRLALSFLRPFFHRAAAVQEDFDIAISYLRTFALTISQWPNPSWVNDHPEVHKVVESMVLALGEELGEKYRHHHQQQQGEISRLQVIIDGLQYSIRTQQQDSQKTVVEVDSDGDFEIEYEESDEPTLVVTTVDVPPSVRKRPSSLDLSTISVLPRIPISFQTPITPPESPNHSFFGIPTVVVPINDAITLTSIPKGRYQDREKDRNMSSNTSPEPSGKTPASPPWRPSRSPIFSPPSAQHLPKPDVPISSDSKEKGRRAACSVEQQLPVNQPLNIVELGAQYTEDSNSSLLSPLIQHWNSPPSGSTFSSRRSSIASVDTLCESSEFPFNKRFSIASYNSDIFDPAPALSIEIPSESRSDPWSTTPRASIPLPPPPETDASIIPLPPSPSSSLSTHKSNRAPSLLSSPIVPRFPLASDLASSSDDSESSVILPKSRICLIGPLPMTQPDAQGDEDNRRSKTTVVETASYIVTGFLVGAFITLFLFSTQRRTLLYLT